MDSFEPEIDPEFLVDDGGRDEVTHTKKSPATAPKEIVGAGSKRQRADSNTKALKAPKPKKKKKGKRSKQGPRFVFDRFPLPLDEVAPNTLPSVQAVWLWDRVASLRAGGVEDGDEKVLGLSNPVSVGFDAPDVPEGTVGVEKGLHESDLVSIRCGLSAKRMVSVWSAKYPEASIPNEPEEGDVSSIIPERLEKLDEHISLKDISSLVKQNVDDFSTHFPSVKVVQEAKASRTKLDTSLPAGSPLVLVLTSSANRATDLVRALRDIGGLPPLKLFARHIKLDEHIHKCQISHSPAAAGTPARVQQLVDAGALHLDRLELVILDMWGGPKSTHVLHPVLRGTSDIAANLIYTLIRSSPKTKFALLPP